MKAFNTVMKVLFVGLLCANAGCQGQTRDLAFFLRRLRTVDHLPELERSHTSMSSTWHRDGSIGDPYDFKRIEGDRNILLDVDGPGCIHRIFTGRVGDQFVKGTHIQIFLDHHDTPIFDMPVPEFFDDQNGPMPYPLVFHKTYPGTLFPIPFAKHCLVQLVSNEPEKKWGIYWQVTYTIYSHETRVKSLTWPPTPAMQTEIDTTCHAWLQAESKPPAPPAKWPVQEQLSMDPGQSRQVTLPGCGTIREMRVAVEPATPEILRNVRMRIAWDGAAQPSVDVPLGYFFGHADYGHAPETRFSSLLLGVTQEEAYCRFPMPFANGARLTFENRSDSKVDKLTIRMDVEKRRRLPDHWGRFHVTWTEKPAVEPDAPRYGAKNFPVHVVLDRTGRGKYVGVLLHVNWPRTSWWGEGDWMIWTDEHDWPPSYHGTGSEEYFNAGWCDFDRKAVSGFVKMRPGDVAVYSFHLNDAFQFQNNMRVAEETLGLREANQIIQNQHPTWSSTAYWYGLPAQPAGSTPTMLPRK